MELTPAIESWRVVAIEDELDNLDLLMTSLKMYGATIAGASTGTEAIDLVDSFKPNLILLDLSMPGIDGWQIHRALRTKTELDDVPIIAVTALVMPSDQIRIREAGFDGYITKPYRIHELPPKIAKCVVQFIARKAEASVTHRVADDPTE
ncbi:MAG: response regulator [Anaerolineae bacterium]|nr:response regulator [Anaerolineae bacterium]